jgi:hypothetical protein
MMVSLSEFDLRITTHNNTIAQRNLPTAAHTAQRATVPGTLAAKLLAMTARFAPLGRHARATTGTAHS